MPADGSGGRNSAALKRAKCSLAGAVDAEEVADTLIAQVMNGYGHAEGAPSGPSND